MIATLLGASYGISLFLIELFLVGPIPLPFLLIFLLMMVKLGILISALFTILLPLFGILGLPFRSTRTVCIQLLLGSFAAIGSVMASIPVADWLRHTSLEEVADKAQPLVNAIHAYERDTGAPPPSLSALVPKYLPKVPGTGFGSSPKFDYYAHGVRYRPTSTWYLGFGTTDFGLMDFDEFFYDPAQRFDGANPSNYYERFGDWVYMHD